MNPTIVAGTGDAADYVASVERGLTDALGFRPYPGTLNLTEFDGVDELPSETVTDGRFVTEHCDGVVLRQCAIAGVRGAVLRPLVAGCSDEPVELVSPVHLRSLFDLKDGDDLVVAPADEVWNPEGLRVPASALQSFDAVVFDLDGTLVNLDVDWPAVNRFIEELLNGALERPLQTYTRFEVMAIARANGVYDELDAYLTEREEEGADGATARPLLEVASRIGCLVGVCTANARSAAKRSLKLHDVSAAIDALISRGSVQAEKPHPHLLLACLNRLDVEPGNAVYVGDERSDAETAVAAGTSFLHRDQICHKG